MGAQFYQGEISPFLVLQERLPGIQVGVEFGTMNREGNCVNVGICRMTSEESGDYIFGKKARRCKRAQAVASVMPSGRFRLQFPKSGMLPCTERAIFKSGGFHLPFDFIIPDGMAFFLPATHRLRLSAGIYPILEDEHQYTILF
ncbi:MAG: hypothetical protein R2792_19285 [Saprospiraceae bacterium]